MMTYSKITVNEKPFKLKFKYYSEFVIVSVLSLSNFNTDSLLIKKDISLLQAISKIENFIKSNNKLLR